MRIVRGIESLPAGLRLVLTVGVFDGLHRGHQALLGALVRAAGEADAVPALVTFDPHPDLVIRGRAPILLADHAETVERVEATGVELIVIERFDDALRAQAAETFVSRIEEGRRLAGIVMSADSAFGRDRGGTPVALRDIGAPRGWWVLEVPVLSLGRERVSSARIRALLQGGRLADAAWLLGRPYALIGEVVHGDGRGRGLGYPTANLAFGEPVCLPPDGIYAVRVSWGGRSPLRPAHLADGVASLGDRPTFDGRERVLEVHLLDRDVDLYGERLRVEVVRRLRGQRRFSAVQDLVAQMGRDVTRARRLFAP